MTEYTLPNDEKVLDDILSGKGIPPNSNNGFSFCPIWSKPMIEKLKSCPFCGGRAEFIPINEKWMVECKVCDGGIDRVFKTKEQAVKAWNQRVGDN